MNHHLKNNMLISVKKSTFEPKIRNSDKNLQTRYEWFLKQKDSDLGYERNCVFIDEAEISIEVGKGRSPSHNIIGTIHSSSIIHVAMKKLSSRKEKV
ncbi:hypothetical protein CU098_013931 [Rhizopus stolonifer]|uniref:Tc1-like transposase DDE domain-containing protein n=1 Tax=Rhizopus stolonifer TaxID=4846 RepID=A0A367KZA8_RHIST|nr:hypothetical protein CU098_013931 [Rhizopus stolonifer]